MLTFTSMVMTSCIPRLVRPGFVRVSLNYYWSPEKVQFVADALYFVGTHGWKLLPECVDVRANPPIGRSII